MEVQRINKTVKTLETKYKKQGKLTYDDVNELLGEQSDPEVIDAILSALCDKGIEVQEEKESDIALGEKIENEIKRLIKIGKIHGHLTYDEVGEKLAVECEANAQQME